MKNVLFLAVTAFLVAACTNEENTRLEYGKIQLSLDASREITVVSRAATDDELANYNLQIFQDGVSKWGPAKYSTLQNIELVYPATTGYTVSAESCTEAEALSANNNWGQARLAGVSSPFAITANQTTNVEFTCTMKNAKVSVAYAPSFSDVFTEYSVTVHETSDAGRSLTFDNNATFDTQAAYFNIDEQPEVSYVVSGKFNGNVKTFTGSVVLAAAKWHRLTIKATSNGKITLGISIDDSVVNDDKDVEVNPYN